MTRLSLLSWVECHYQVFFQCVKYRTVVNLRTVQALCMIGNSLLIFQPSTPCGDFFCELNKRYSMNGSFLDDRSVENLRTFIGGIYLVYVSQFARIFGCPKLSLISKTEPN
jgi:hypothetical protein